ncbi:hypothetical protein TNCT_74031 [Trichonephila clavata]|uniref:Uncharacterized protein n=1 Tax=Trichonephila clavata TaxID=2740835 RepID=A0A8X6I7J3_TRICU|nr:hypothetical protein TNCT_74031 [Trichonephila clavata]
MRKGPYSPRAHDGETFVILEKLKVSLWMSPTQVRTISEYGVWIVVTWAESKPTTFQGNRHLQNLPTESLSILQPSLIFDSIKLQSTTSQENIEIFEPDVSDNNDSTEGCKYSEQK